MLSGTWAWVTTPPRAASATAPRIPAKLWCSRLHFMRPPGRRDYMLISPTPPGSSMAFSHLHAVTRHWFTHTFGAPTPAQDDAWSSIGQGQHTVVAAPTGSGKTLAAF